MKIQLYAKAMKGMLPFFTQKKGSPREAGATVGFQAGAHHPYLDFKPGTDVAVRVQAGEPVWFAYDGSSFTEVKEHVVPLSTRDWWKEWEKEGGHHPWVPLLDF
ncbi:MAG: hypothetical protein Q7S00_06535 [bacterium]|nr:hypothetical protein [bacterium]